MEIFGSSTLANKDTNFESREDLRNGKFGFPIPFVYQDLIASGLNGYEGDFPHKFGLQMDFLDNVPEVEFKKLNFLLSVMIVFCVLMTLYFTWCKLYRSGFRVKR